MQKSRFTEEQIVFALKQTELDTSVPDVCRKLGISGTTFTPDESNTAKFPPLNSNLCGNGQRKSTAEERRCLLISAPTRRCCRKDRRPTDVAGMLDSIAHRRPLPQVLKADNGSGFAGNILDSWVYESGIGVSRPGTPADNATVGSFNGRLRQAGLNENGCISLEDERAKSRPVTYAITRVVPIVHRAGYPQRLLKNPPVARICSQNKAGYS
nr:transposase [Edwardsiella ictaluri]